jgi:protein-tyrosine sulfotransferase
VVFLHGVLQRSGTNYLFNLLSHHPDCHSGGIFEDFLSSASPLLTAYIATLAESWNNDWLEEPKDEVCKRLAARLGDALIAFLAEGMDERCLFLTKTPSTLNLQNCLPLFPGARVILVIRDGRDVVASGMRTFNWEWESAVRQWTLSARRIQEFLRHHENARQVLLVRFEDLFQDTRTQLRRIFRFLELDPERIDWTSVEATPIRGSCAYGRDETAPVDWRAVTRSSDFFPLGRYRDWSKRRRQRFQWLAGEVSAEFGYPVTEGAACNPLTNALDWTLDRWWQVRRRWNGASFHLKHALLHSTPDYSTGTHHYYRQSIAAAERTPALLAGRPGGVA